MPREGRRRWKRGSGAGGASPSGAGEGGLWDDEGGDSLWQKGFIKHVDKEKGYGFIACQESYQDGGSDVFVPEKIINGVSRGDLVAFQSISTPKGLQATLLEHDHESILPKAAGVDDDDPRQGEDDWDADHQVHEGTIVKFDDSRGFGFIHCEELNERLGKDVFIHEKQLSGFWVGDRVRFNLRTNAKGQPQASNLEPAFEETFDSELNMTFRGTIKTKTKGTVFIHCPEATKTFGGDVFVPSGKVGNFESGDPVHFTVKVSRKGQPQVSSISSVLPHELTMPASMRAAAMGSGVDAADQGNSAPSGCSHEGTIKSVNVDKGFGMIDCEELHGMFRVDTYVEKKQLGAFQVGDVVRFTIRMNERNQPQAVDLAKPRPPEARDAHLDANCPPWMYLTGEALTGDGLLAANADGGGAGHRAESDLDLRREGVVKKLDADKGFGFIFCQEIHDLKGTDVYVDKKDIGRLRENDRVSFGLKTNARGRLQAVSIAPAALAAESAADAAGGEEDVCSGCIKSFDEANGYGFISSTEVQAKHNRDVFLHKAQIKNFKVGDQVAFNVRIIKGAPQAYDLREAPRSTGWLASEGQEPGVTAGPSPEEEEHNGVIKSFNVGKGYGFIDCQDLFALYRRDVFIHQSQFEGRMIGDHVTFKVQVVKGQPQARDVVLSEPGAVANAAASASVPAASSSPLEGLEAAALSRKLLRACASARPESVDTIQELLAANADPNVADEATGQRPLQMAALNVRHSERKCQLLVEHCADVQAECSETHTVVQWARERINPKFAAFLEALQRGENALPLETILNENPPEEF